MPITMPSGLDSHTQVLSAGDEKTKLRTQNKVTSVAAAKCVASLKPGESCQRSSQSDTSINIAAVIINTLGNPPVEKTTSVNATAAVIIKPPIRGVGLVCMALGRSGRSQTNCFLGRCKSINIPNAEIPNASPNASSGWIDWVAISIMNFRC